MSDLYRDKNGNQLSLFEWANLFENMDYRIIGRDQVGKWRISTVWIGLYVPFDYMSCMFETGIFEGEELLDMIRYQTHEEAKLGHAAEVWKYKCMEEEQSKAALH